MQNRILRSLATVAATVAAASTLGLAASEAASAAPQTPAPAVVHAATAAVTPAPAARQVPRAPQTCRFVASHAEYKEVYYYKLKIHVQAQVGCGHLPLRVAARVICKYSRRGSNLYKVEYGQAIGLGDTIARCPLLGSGDHPRGFGWYGYRTWRNGVWYRPVRLGDKPNVAEAVHAKLASALTTGPAPSVLRGLLLCNGVNRCLALRGGSCANGTVIQGRARETADNNEVVRTLVAGSSVYQITFAKCGTSKAVKPVRGGLRLEPRTQGGVNWRVTYHGGTIWHNVRYGGYMYAYPTNGRQVVTHARDGARSTWKVLTS